MFLRVELNMARTENESKARKQIKELINSNKLIDKHPDPLGDSKCTVPFWKYFSSLVPDIIMYYLVVNGLLLIWRLFTH